MAHAGQTIHNPVTGETITFLKTTAETGGELLVFECRSEPGKTALAPHLHTNQEERFTMLSGTLGVRLGKEVHTLRPGDKMTLPAGVVHQWWNPTDEEVSFYVEVTPARNLETTLEAICGMANEGKLTKQAMPRNPFRLAQFGKLSETYLPVIPVWMQKMGLNMGSLAGSILGYDATFASYCTPASATPAVAATSIPETSALEGVTA
jgi:quercetin dioxygenase-like cupin family protein